MPDTLGRLCAVNTEQTMAAIIVAAGSSRRMGFDKLMAPLCGASVLQQTVWALLKSPDISELIIVTDSERFHSLDLTSSSIPVICVDGGEERHHSVANGLAALSQESQYVAVHDAARPLITSTQIQRVYQQALKDKAATSARRVTETLKRADDSDFATSSVDREHLWLMETPQIFETSLLKRAYQNVLQTKTLVTDEVSAMETIGVPTRLVPNQTMNPKITFPEDLELATLLKLAMEN